MSCNYMDSDMETEQLLRDIYCNLKTGFQSAERLYQKALENGLNVSRKEVRITGHLYEVYTNYKKT